MRLTAALAWPALLAALLTACAPAVPAAGRAGCDWARIVAINPSDRLTWPTARAIFDSNGAVWRHCAPPAPARPAMRQRLPGVAEDENEG